MKTILLTLKSSLLLRHIFFVLLLLPFISPTRVLAQDVKEEWVRRYGSSTASTIGTVHLAVDKAGNSYVTGAIIPMQVTNARIITVKYSPEGEELWVAYHLSPFQANATGIAVDKNGDVYVVGTDDAYTSSRGTALILKYDGDDGTQLWQKRHNPYPASRGLDILTDNQGNVFVVGNTTLSFNIYFLSRLNPADGSVEWNRILTRTGNDEDYANNLLKFIDFALDNAGDVYVTGTFSQSASAQDIITLKYKGTDGENLWVQNDDQAGNSVVTGLAVEDTGGVYISGASDGATEGFLIKYASADGEVKWNNPVPQSGTTITATNNLTADNAGGVYYGSATGETSHIGRYSTDTGFRTWQTSFAGTLTNLVADRAGALYAAGNTSDTEYHLRKYNAATGQQLWLQTSGEATSTDERTDFRVSAIVTNSEGHLYVTSSYSMPSLQGRNYMLTKYNSATGELEWVNHFARSNNDDISVDVAVDAEGNSYVTGVSGDVSGYMRDGIKREIVTIKYSPDGEEMWVSNYPLDNSTNSGAGVRKIVVDKTGGVYITGLSGGDFLTIKYSASDGELIWAAYHDTGNVGDDVADIAVDNAGGVYITGFNPGASAKVATIKYNALDGSIIWVSNFGRGGSTTAISVMNGFVYVAARSYITRPNGSADFDMVLIKYNAVDGKEEHVSFFNSGSSDYPIAMAMDATDGIYILGQSAVGFTGLIPVLVKFNAVTGAQLWSANSESNMSPRGLAVDDKEGIFIAGYKEKSTVLIKFDPFGRQTWIKEEAAGSIILPTQTIEVDGAGGVYLARTVSAGIKTSKYNTSDGTLQWEIQKEVNIKNLYATSPQVNLILDSNRNVIVSGYDRNDDSGDMDFLTIKYSQQAHDNLLCFDPLPVQLSLPPHAVRVGEQVLTTADFGDYVPGEKHNIRWMWGDQGQPTIAYFAKGDSHITGEHTYSQAGIYKVGLDFSESCLIAANDDYKEWMVIYDPSAGSVTGGGQLRSLQTTLPWMSKQQHAQFSFNVRYNKPNDSVPQGQTQLNLREQGVFKSNAIEWLVVNGNQQALWQGTGTLNGKGNYGFTASVWDGRGTGSNDEGDEIRIRIWDKNAGNAIVYDNFETAGDIYDMTNPTSRIVRGQIIIHPMPVASATTATTQQAALYNYPNTFKDKTTITFTAEKAGVYSLEVYDMRGKLVKQLWQGQATEGQSYSVELDGTTWPKGMYVTRLVGDSGAQSIRMLLER